MSQVDEGLIHAWLDGQLPPDESARIEQLVATDAAWGAAAAEARGFVAGASRILNALDTVPDAMPERRVGNGGGVSRRGWRTPWIRAAAVLVVVGGLGGMLWQRLPQRAVPADEEVRDSRNAALQSAATRSAAPPVLAPAPPVASGGAPIATASPPPFARPAPLARDSSARNEIGRVDAGARPLGARPLGGAQSLTSPTPVPPARDDKALRAEARQADRLSTENLKQTDSVDPRLAGCWLKTDSTGRSPDRDGLLLRFVPPVATDAQAAAAQAAAPPLRPPVARPPLSAAKDAAPANAKTINAILNQSFAPALAAMWVDEHGVTALQFSVKGDTVTGTTRLSAGDVAYPLMPFRARRVACPR